MCRICVYFCITLLAALKPLLYPLIIQNIICTHQSLNRCIIQQAIGFLMKAALKSTNDILCSHGKPLMPQQ